MCLITVITFRFLLSGLYSSTINDCVAGHLHFENPSSFKLCSYSPCQVGLAELKVVVERTGGIVVLAESFGSPVFRDSFRRIFQSSDFDLGLSFK